MKRFRYRLESYLHLKDKKASDKLVSYAEKIRIRRAVELEIEKSVNHLDSVKKGIEELRKGEFSASNQSYYLAELQRLKKILIDLEKNKISKQQEEAKAREMYMQARSEKEILIKLKEKKRQQFFKDQLKLEQKMLDEVIQSRINHKI